MEIQVIEGLPSEHYNCRSDESPQWLNRAGSKAPLTTLFSSNSCTSKGELKTSSRLVERGYVLMILPQVHLRNGDKSAFACILESDRLS